jgi:hypothetical protein
MSHIASLSSKWLTDFTEVPVVASPNAQRAVLDTVSRSHQVHLRSLVRGLGPTASASGLLRRSPSGWKIAASEETLALWRS